MSTVDSQDFITRCTRGTLGLLLWSLAWVGSLILVDKSVLYGWTSSNALLIVGVVANALLGLGVIWVYLQYLRGIDELQRKIQLDALALGMGAGVIGSFAYSLLVTIGVVTEPEVNDIVLLMVGVYMASIVIGQVRYR